MSLSDARERAKVATTNKDWRTQGIELGLILLALLFTGCGFVQLALVERGQVTADAMRPCIVMAVLGIAGWGVLTWRAPARDPLLVPIAVLLCGWGLIEVARLQEAFLNRQLIWVGLGFVALLLIAALPYRWYWLSRYRYLWLLGGLGLLLLTILWGVNPLGIGDRLWLSLAGLLYFQPSEVLKVLLVVFMASYLAEKRELLVMTHVRVGRLRLPPLPYLIPLLLMWGFSLILLVWQRDLGAALLFFSTFLSMLYVATERKLYAAAGLGLLLLVAFAGYQLFDRVRLRGDIWLNPWSDPQGDAYQIVQSLLAFASGGLFGSGVGLGYPTPHIPVVHTDFVFAAIGEEWGMLGALGLVLALMILVARGLRAAMQAAAQGQGFVSLLAVGLSAMLGWQSLIITGGTLKLIPLTGITLPFVSYGGSSMLVSCAMVGLLVRGGLDASDALIREAQRRGGTQGVGIERQIRQLGIVLSICFLLTAAGLGYWSLIRAPELVGRAYNPRWIEAERRVRRGDILDRAGRPLVRSEPGPLGTWQRVYLVPEAAPVVGYYAINHGTGGIEHAYDAQIRGARTLSPIDRLRADLLHLHPAGITVTLTIDVDVQQAASRALGEQMGAVVVLDVQDGDILAMVSNPTFDPNSLEVDWPLLNRSRDKPMLNRATQGLYPPGLVFETITLAATIAEGVAQPTTAFTDELGVLLSVEPPISCPSSPPRKQFTLAEAYLWPCNVLFARLGLELGGERLADYAARLGVGRPLDLPLEASRGQLLERGVWSRLIAARTAMGQGEVLVTPLEMALATATLANDGLRPVPRLVLSAGEEAVPPAGEPSQVLRADVARQVRDILAQAFAAAQQAVPLSDVLALDGIDVAGRAGPAESGQPGAPAHAWFIGYAPAVQPRYAVAVVIEYGEQGWEVAAPVAVQVLAQAMQTLRVSETLRVSPAG